ncbi:tRNA (N(6)-L-threonylcarbamoyladenosine(37)-C(2))-methylthiotransferase MtaB [Simkania negevensis]|uniref:tRNA-2-methylthio-N(6)-dimethylallyladenosine synthase n=1 Tax=Simkania negevensis TaxID=83561 RepID=A0ABS3AQ48_9BACT|nr:tRNA (N(6)-L-threonylcarbamoyladenosine(37)-C(2))-methylthiotransferase MtaB [Simkania negevensis]
MSDQKTFRIATLGCRTNQYESQGYRTQLESLGLVPAKADESADVCIINTCTVTEAADSDSRHKIRRLVRNNPGSKVVVTGCLAERNPALAEEVEGIDLLVPNKGKEQLIELLYPDIENYPEFIIDQFEGHTRAFIKIQDGCNSFCTYCIIPYVRGRSRSRKVTDILREIEGLVRQGYKEVVITGINVGDFDGGVDKGEAPVSLATLIREVDKVDGLERIRLSSIDPDEVDDDLADAVLNGKKTCHSMHIVLQAGSNAILKRMNRKYTRQVFMETVERLREASPRFTFTTDVIVGFPGEMERDFQETIEVMEQVEFAKVHMFPYSDRPRTRANLYTNKVTSAVIKERKQLLLRKAEEVAYRLRERFVGETMRVLTEKTSDNNKTIGHTENFLPVVIKDYSLPSNELITVQLTQNTPEGLVGQLVGEEVF